jgi:hypothetical protein
VEPDAASESAAEISLRQELDALRLQLTTTSAAVAHGTATDGLANVPGEVPPIRSNLQSTQGMQAAKETLLAETGAQAVAVSSKGAAAGAKVGAFGMGGIGKTIMAAWICRDEDIRKHFDVILWITLSQTPNVPKGLDDCWESTHEAQINTVDISAGSKLLGGQALAGFL